MIRLYQNFDKNTKLLDDSLNHCGIDCPCIVVNEDGFLPDGVESAFSYFTHMDKHKKHDKALFFNQVPIPEFWEIKGTFLDAEIIDKQELRGKIYYNKCNNERIVKVVDWLDKTGKVRFCDHYDKYGYRYAQSVIDKDGKTFQKLWFDKIDGQIKILQNFTTGDIILTEAGKDMLFHTLTDFYIYYFYKRELNLDNVIFNSLFYPYYIVDRLYYNSNANTENYLFWQEPIQKDIPANMSNILAKEDRCTHTIFVTNKNAFAKLKDVDNIFKQIGYVYDFKTSKNSLNDAFVFTNSDEVVCLKELVEACTNITFHVAAVTEMSPKLLAFNDYENVELYPCITTKIIDKLFATCGIFLDINRGIELHDAVFNAFLHNQLIFGFDQTLHNEFYLSPDNIYKVGDVKLLINKLNKVNKDDAFAKKLLKAQKGDSISETKKSFISKL